MSKFRISFTAYDSHYPNPNVFHEAVTITRKSMDKSADRQQAESEIRNKRGFSRVVIDGWEEEK